MMFQTLLRASFVLLFTASAFGQGAAEAPVQPAKRFTLTQVWRLDANYADRQRGLSFQYPSVWRPETSFGYHPPALTASDEKPIAGFGYSEGGFPRDRVVGPYSATNLEGFGIVYSAAPTTGVAACEAKAASMSEAPGHRTVVFGGRSFSEYTTGEAGMSQSNEGKLFATYVRPVCYLLETDVAVSEAGAFDGIQTLTPAQMRSIEAHLLRIMESVRIVPRGR